MAALTPRLTVASAALPPSLPGEDDLSFSSVHREPDSTSQQPYPSLDPAAFFHPVNPTSPTLDEPNSSSGPSLILSEMSSSGGDTSHPRSTSGYSSFEAAHGGSASNSRSGYRQPYPPAPQHQQQQQHQQRYAHGQPQLPFRPHYQHQQGVPSGRSSFGRPSRPPPSSLHAPNAYNPAYDPSPTSPTRPTFGGGLPGVEGSEADSQVAGGGSQGWTPFPVVQPPMGAPPSGPRPSLGGALYPPGSSSSAASSPGAYPSSMGGFDPRLASPTLSSTSPIQSSSSASSNRYRPHNPNFRPPYPPSSGPYASHQNRPPPHAYYQQPNQFYPPSPMASPDPSSPMQPHTVQGPDGQTWMYFPVPVASGFYPPGSGPGGAPYPNAPGGNRPLYGGGGAGSVGRPSPYLGFNPVSPRQPQASPYGGFQPTSPRQPPSAPFVSSHPVVRKPYHPPAPPARSEHVMWVGNVASDATQDELLAFFSKSVPEGSIASIFNISRSQCCFVNFNSQEALDRGISTFNGTPLRPDEGARSPRLVCRVRRKEDDLKAGVGGQRGRGVHTGWVKERQAQAASQMKAGMASGTVEGGDDGGIRQPAHQGSTSSIRTMSSQASTDSSFLAKNFPIRFFIMKSLTSVDLETSVQQGLWATQVHNEATLDQAYRTSREVILIFGANKTGEFFGYAKMAGSIGKSDRRISWASREGSGSSGRSPLSPGRGSFSSVSHPATHHQRSAPERIAEGVEPESSSNDPSPEPQAPRAVSNPPAIVLSPKAIDAANATATTTIPTVASSSANTSSRFLFPSVQDSPGEISPGHEKEYASLGSELSPISAGGLSSSSKAPSLLSRVLDRDGKGERSSAPGHLESHRRLKSDESIPKAGGSVATAPGTLDPADLRRLSIGKALGGAAGAGTTSSLPGSNIPGNKPPTAEDKPDDDGVKRTDQLSSSSSSLKNPSSGGSGGSSRAVPANLPNLHLPAEDGKSKAGGGGGGGDGVEVWGTPFKIEWVKTTRLPFHRVRHLRNPWNQDREIKVSRDGTEVEPEVGRLLLQAWDSPLSPPPPPPAQAPGFLLHSPPQPQQAFPPLPLQHQHQQGLGLSMGGGNGGGGGQNQWDGYEMGRH